jgi:hypothetical protein
MANNKEVGNKSKTVSRRNFLVAGGAVIAAGALSACSAKTITNSVTNTVTSTAPAKTVTPAAVTSTVSVPQKFTVLNPRGLPKPVDKVPLVPPTDTADSIKTKSIWLVGQKGAQQAPLPAIFAEMQKEGYKVTLDGKASFFGSDEPTLWDKVAKDAKAVIFGVGD